MVRRTRGRTFAAAACPFSASQQGGWPHSSRVRIRAVLKMGLGRRVRIRIRVFEEG